MKPIALRALIGLLCGAVSSFFLCVTLRKAGLGLAPRSEVSNSAACLPGFCGAGSICKLPGLERKVRVLTDWTLELFFPRDIVQTIDFNDSGVRQTI
jgi:hypothetical protein